METDLRRAAKAVPQSPVFVALGTASLVTQTAEGSCVRYGRQRHLARRIIGTNPPIDRFWRRRLSRKRTLEPVRPCREFDKPPCH